MENLKTVCWPTNCLRKVFFLNREYLTQPIHMQLSIKTKDILEFFSAILKNRLSFDHFQEKHDTHSEYIYEITHSEKRS